MKLRCVFLVINVRLWDFFLVTKLMPSVGAIESVTTVVPRVEVEVAC
jgi:hypothetical protein